MIAAKGLTRRFAACAALVAFALLSFVSAPVRADEVQWAGVTIAYTNAVVTYSNPDDLDVSDLILTYTDISAPGSLTLPEEWSVRYLVVGGGGAHLDALNLEQVSDLHFCSPFLCYLRTTCLPFVLSVLWIPGAKAPGAPLLSGTSWCPQRANLPKLTDFGRF